MLKFILCPHLLIMMMMEHFNTTSAKQLHASRLSIVKAMFYISKVVQIIASHASKKNYACIVLNKNLLVVAGGVD